jgi:hypothetical protein
VLERTILRVDPIPPELLSKAAAEFPRCAITTGLEPHSRPLRVVQVDTAGWLTVSLYKLDAAITEAAESGPTAVEISVPETANLSQTVLSVLTRYQRLIAHRNRHSDSLSFSRILDAHRRLHPLGRPLVRADYDHAIDTWQWLLRLSPGASMALQIAALFHDIERLISEAEHRVEASARDYQAFKDAHAARGAALTRHILAELGVAKSVVDEATELITAHERPPQGDDEARRFLNDADALSFFSLNSMGFFDYFGFEHTQSKVAYTLRRLSEEGIARLRTFRLPPVIATLVADELDAPRWPRSFG